MNESLQSSGGCYCGQIKFQVKGEVFVSTYCHCRQCQQSTGGAGSCLSIFKKGAFNVIKGSPKEYQYANVIGHAMKCYFCGMCGSQIYTDLKNHDPLVAIRATAFEDPIWVQPTNHIWVSAKQSWDFISDDLPQSPEGLT